MPKRIQLSRKKGWRKPEGVISVARPTKFGNPFAIGARVPISWDEHPSGASIEAETNAEAVAYYRDWMSGVVEVQGVARPDPSQLRGHDLACWCPLDQQCHADVLLEIANE